MLAGLNTYVVKEARRMAAAGMTVAEIGVRLGVDPGRLADAIAGVTYAHVKHPPAVALGGVARETPPDGASEGSWLLSPGAVRALRTDRLGLSQQQFAELIRRTCAELGHDGARCSKRLVQKWESGEHAMPLGHYREALAHIAGLSIESLCAFAPRAEPGYAAERIQQIISRHNRLRIEVQGVHHALIDLYMELAVEAKAGVADGPVPEGAAGVGADAAEDQ